MLGPILAVLAGVVIMLSSAPSSAAVRERDGKRLTPALRAEYAAFWSSLALRPGWESKIERAVARIRAGMEHYRAVEARTGVPAAIIGVIHWMESACDFGRHLHNGDPLTARTVRVPAGRPVTGSPPFSWQASAIDALSLRKMDQWRDWSIEGTLWQLEGYNGMGYRRRGLPTPYLWSGTPHYTSGKYVADGVFDPNAVSTQVGVAPILKVLLGGTA